MKKIKNVKCDNLQTFVILSDISAEFNFNCDKTDRC